MLCNIDTIRGTCRHFGCVRERVVGCAGDRSQHFVCCKCKVQFFFFVAFFVIFVPFFLLFSLLPLLLISCGCAISSRASSPSRVPCSSCLLTVLVDTVLVSFGWLVALRYLRSVFTEQLRVSLHFTTNRTQVKVIRRCFGVLSSLCNDPCGPCTCIVSDRSLTDVMLRHIVCSCGFFAR